MLLKNMNVLSVDQSLTSMGLFLYLGRDNSKTMVKTIKTVKTKTVKGVKINYSLQDRFKVIFKEILSFFPEYEESEIDLILFEGSILHFKKSSSSVIIDLAQLKGFLRLFAIIYGAEVLEMPVQTWKSWIGAKRYDKKNPAKYCRDIEKDNRLVKGYFSNTDEADAYLMLLALFKINSSPLVFGAAEGIKAQLKDMQGVNKLNFKDGE